MLWSLLLVDGINWFASVFEAWIQDQHQVKGYGSFGRAIYVGLYGEILCLCHA